VALAWADFTRRAQDFLATQRRHSRRLWLLGMLGLTALLIVLVAPGLAHYPPITGDEVWIMSASHKLATQGVLGVDMFAGFLGADRYYFIGLPVQHLWQAAVFKLFGAGLSQARWASLLAGIGLVWIVGSLAFRWYGWATALLASALLVYWRNSLLLGVGLPFIQVARSSRYDMGAVTLFWLSILLLDSAVRSPSRLKLLATGAAAGLAALTQLTGFFVWPFLAGVGLKRWRARQWPWQSLAWLALGVALFWAPYASLITLHWPEFSGQASLKAGRIEFNRPMFYVDNLRHEPRRFAQLGQTVAKTLRGEQHAYGAVLLVLGFGPAVAIVGRQAWRQRRRLDYWLLGSGLLAAGQLALLEATKAILYGIILLPALCLLFAVALTTIGQWATRPERGRIIRFSLVSGLAGMLVLLSTVTVLTVVDEHTRAAAASDYAVVGRQIDAYLPASAAVLGTERWWWALHEHPYLATRVVTHDWPAGTLPAQLADIDYVIISVEDRDGLASDRAALANFTEWIRQCGTKVADWTDVTYDRIEIYQMAKGAACQR
jgi:4-amino-4-deoxy-L-arabinose transferase-like glycosyltransferase